MKTEYCQKFYDKAFMPVEEMEKHQRILTRPRRNGYQLPICLGEKVNYWDHEIGTRIKATHGFLLANRLKDESFALFRVYACPKLRTGIDFDILKFVSYDSLAKEDCPFEPIGKGLTEDEVKQIMALWLIHAKDKQLNEYSGEMIGLDGKVFSLRTNDYIPQDYPGRDLPIQLFDVA